MAAISVVACCVFLPSITPASPGAQLNPARLPPDGTFLSGVDGKLAAGEGGDMWLFELVADANSVRGPIAAGTQFELLPCATLALLIADVNDRYAPTYRLSARVTRFHGKSFLYPTYYLPLSKLKDAKSGDEPNDGFPSVRAAASGQDDPDLAIPREVVEKLKGRRMVRGPQKERAAGAESERHPDRTLVDAIGRIEPAAGPAVSDAQPTASADRFVFIPDAFGWNVGGMRYELLPCGVLEQAIQKQAASPERLRFSVVGLVTEFKGKQYLLLNRAIRAYGYGNFAK